MSRVALLNTLKKYEEMDVSFDYEISAEASKYDVQTIKNDINRCNFRFSRIFRSFFCHKLYIYILSKTFKDFPLPYYQCMMDIASVILDAYIEDKALRLKADNINMESEFQDHIELSSITDNEELLFSQFFAANKTICEKFKRSILIIFQTKILNLTENDFKLYESLNKTFLHMLEERKGLRLGNGESLSYMNHTLTFFQRISGNSDVAFKFLNLILNSDPHIIFCILFHFFDKIKNCKGQVVIINEQEARSKLIYDLQDRDMKDILAIYESFFQYKNKSEEGSHVKWCFFLVAASAIVLAGAYKYYK